MGPYSEGVAVTIAPVLLKRTWSNLRGQIYGFHRNYHPVPHLWPLVWKTLKCSSWMDTFSELKRLCLSCWGHLQPVHLDYLNNPSSRWQLSVWKLCVFLECQHFSLISHIHVTQAFHGVPFFILFSCLPIWVFPSLIFYKTGPCYSTFSLRRTL